MMYGKIKVCVVTCRKCLIRQLIRGCTVAMECCKLPHVVRGLSLACMKDAR